MPLPIFEKEKKENHNAFHAVQMIRRGNEYYLLHQSVFLFGTHPNHDALTKFHQRRLVTRKAFPGT
jgi:hypothetical protein